MHLKLLCKSPYIQAHFEALNKLLLLIKYLLKCPLKMEKGGQIRAKAVYTELKHCGF